MILPSFLPDQQTKQGPYGDWVASNVCICHACVHFVMRTSLSVRATLSLSMEHRGFAETSLVQAFMKHFWPS